MKKLLRWMHWINSKGKLDWFEISTDIIILTIFSLAIYMGILFHD